MDETAFLSRFRTARLGRPHPGAYPPPAYEASWERFAAMLDRVGGAFVPTVARAAAAAAVNRVLAELPAGRRVASAAALPFLAGVPGVEAIEPAARSNPCALEDVEIGILVGELAVAENAAVLLSARTLPERALAFLPQRQIILVPEDVLLPDLVSAQARLPVPPPHHLTWVSGPSKTADIEQTLVIGAHGARSLTVIVIGK